MAMDEVNAVLGNIRTICSPAIIGLLGNPIEIKGYYSLRLNVPIQGLSETASELAMTFNDLMKDVAKEKPELYATWMSIPRITKEQFYTLE